MHVFASQAPNGTTVTLRTQAFINNKFVDAASGKTFENPNPATEDVICKVWPCFLSVPSFLVFSCDSSRLLIQSPYLSPHSRDH
jgi:hypothetical protein